MTSTNIISSRGCPYGCTFCDKSVAGRNFRARSAKNIADEMKYHGLTYTAISRVKRLSQLTVNRSVTKHDFHRAHEVEMFYV